MSTRRVAVAAFFALAAGVAPTSCRPQVEAGDRDAEHEASTSVKALSGHDLFREHCKTCHTFEDEGAVGGVFAPPLKGVVSRFTLRYGERDKALAALKRRFASAKEHFGDHFEDMEPAATQVRFSDQQQQALVDYLVQLEGDRP